MASIERVIASYRKSTEDFVDEYLVELTPDMLRGLWEAHEGDDQYYMIYQVEPKQKTAIEELLGEKLDFNKYDYFLETHVS